MNKVWANSGTKSSFMSNDSWKWVIPFTGLSDLVEKLRQKNIANGVDVLAIVAHGDLGGQVQLTPPLTNANVDAARAELVQLRSFIKPGGRLMFLACMAAVGPVGDAFLRKVSQIMTSCEVVGFIVANEVFAPLAGNLKVFSQNSFRNDEWSEETKWALNGSIIKPPNMEVLKFQMKDPSKKNHCGSDKCPGHSRQGIPHCCAPYKRSSWPRWVDR
jgi:Domain of unknown function (DUF4347)